MEYIAWMTRDVDLYGVKILRTDRAFIDLQTMLEFGFFELQDEGEEQ